MKKVLIALILSIVLTIASTVVPQVIFGFTQTETESTEIIIGDTPPPSWTRGFPFKIMTYEDCPAGCIGGFNGEGMLLNIAFYFVVSYLGLRYLRK